MVKTAEWIDSSLLTAFRGNDRKITEKDGKQEPRSKDGDVIYRRLGCVNGSGSSELMCETNDALVNMRCYEWMVGTDGIYDQAKALD